MIVLVLSRDDTAATIAAAVFVFGSLTDGLDGYLARRYAGATTIGQWLDPLADKILVAAPISALAAIDAFPVWAAAAIVLRELAVSLLRTYLGRRDVSMPASRWGKVKTAVQMVLVPLYLLPLGEGAETPRYVVLVVAVVLTLWSGLDYFLKAWRRAPARSA